MGRMWDAFNEKRVSVLIEILLGRKWDGTGMSVENIPELPKTVETGLNGTSLQHKKAQHHHHYRRCISNNTGKTGDVDSPTNRI